MDNTYKIEGLSTDILDKVKSDFIGCSETAIDMLNNVLEKNEYLRNERYIRCIIFLADKSLTELSNYIRAAEGDTQRVRDFNKRFDENDLSIRQDLK